VAWAKTHLKNAGLIENPVHGKVSISEAGRKVLLNKPATINCKFLKQFPSYLKFIGHSPGQADQGEEKAVIESTQTPLELMDASFSTLRKATTEELLARLKACSPGFFEHVVVRLLRAMGYGGVTRDASVIGKSGDGGIDGIIKKDKLGLDVVCIQAKRWEGSVAGPVIRGFVGAVTHWLPLNAPLLIRQNTLRAVRLFCSVTDEAHLGQHPMPVDQMILHGIEPDCSLPVQELWKRLANGEGVWRDVPQGGPPVERTVVAGDHCREVFSIDIRGVSTTVDRIEFDATLHAYYPPMPLVEESEYSSIVADPAQKETHARLGRWKGADDGLVKELVIIGYPTISKSSSEGAELSGTDNPAR
jgi:hypothetical protein